MQNKYAERNIKYAIVNVDTFLIYRYACHMLVITLTFYSLLYIYEQFRFFKN